MQSLQTAGMGAEQQGLSRSMILTTANYSISLRLAISTMIGSIYNDEGLDCWRVIGRPCIQWAGSSDGACLITL
jgi:hypothetical protein